MSMLMRYDLEDAHNNTPKSNLSHPMIIHDGRSQLQLYIFIDFHH